MSKLNKNLSYDSDSREFDENVPTKESVNFSGLRFKDTKSQSSQLRQVHEIDIQTTEKPQFPPVFVDSRITLHIQKGPVIKIPKKRKKFKSLNEEISYALSDIQQKQSKESERSSKSKSSFFKKSMPKLKDALSKEIQSQTNESLEINSNDTNLIHKQIKSTTLEKSIELMRICRICKLNKPNQFIQPCDCINDNRYVHCNCLAKLIEQTLEYDQCKICKSNYKLDQFKIIKKRKSIWSFFSHSRKNFNHLIELPFYLGFIFFLLILGIVQWEQSYKVIYVYWSAILIFLTILIVFNHIVFFIYSIYDLKNKINRFRNVYFDVLIEINNKI